MGVNEEQHNTPSAQYVMAESYGAEGHTANGQTDAYYGSEALDLLKDLYVNRSIRYELTDDESQHCFELLRKTGRLP